MQNINKLTLQTQVNKARYMIQLDALRAIAVFGVLIQHFLPQKKPILAFGSLGVILFFLTECFLNHWNFITK